MQPKRISGKDFDINGQYIIECYYSTAHKKIVIIY